MNVGDNRSVVFRLWGLAGLTQRLLAVCKSLTRAPFPHYWTSNIFISESAL